LKVKDDVTLFQFLNEQVGTIVSGHIYHEQNAFKQQIIPSNAGSFSSSLRSVTWNREECVFLGDFIASANGTSFGIIDSRSKEGPFATPLPIAKSPGIVSTAPGGGGA